MDQFSDPEGENTKSFQFKESDGENSNTIQSDFSEKSSKNMQPALKSKRITKQSKKDKIIKDLYCALCDKTFKHQKTFENHIKKHRFEANDPQKVANKNKTPHENDYKCHICLLKFHLIVHKNNHVKKDHAGEKICHICKKKCQTPVRV